MNLQFPSWEREKWRDLADNPVIAPQEGTWPGSVIADPQVVLPGEFDDQWHLFCHYGHLYHFVSENGIKWRLAHDYADWGIGPVSLTADGRQWILYCTQYEQEVFINVRTSQDLVHWSDPVPVLTPESNWEREGNPIQVRNPSAALLPDGRWRLYYCGGTVWLADCGYEEPKHVGLAESDGPLGPIILPSGDGWKKAIVYQLDLRYFEGKLWLYYNARDGWKEGREGIGCSVLDWSGPEPRKLWRLPPPRPGQGGGRRA